MISSLWQYSSNSSPTTLTLTGPHYLKFTAPHPSPPIIISGLSLALAVNLNAQNLKLSLKCLRILQFLRIFSHYYIPLSTTLASNPKLSIIPTGFHITGKHATKTHFFNSKKIVYTSIRPKGLPRWLSGKKNPPANEGDVRDRGSIPESEHPHG